MAAPIPPAAGLRRLAGRVHAPGPAPLFHLLNELVARPDPISRIEAFAALDPTLIAAFGGDRLAPLRISDGDAR